MRQRKVELSSTARDDLFALYDWIARAGGEAVAVGYVSRLNEYCLGFDMASRRGISHEDIYPGLRVVGFERRVTIAFTVEENRVVVMRFFYGGQDWKEIFKNDPGDTI